MFDLITRNAESIFNFFVVYENDNKQTKILIPSDTNSELIDRIIEFGPECCKQPIFTEYYVLLFTDSAGRLEYAHCLQTSDNIFICFTSFLPWFDCFYRILEEVKSKELFKSEMIPILLRFLEKLKNIEPPPANKNALSIPYPVSNASGPQPRGRNPPTSSIKADLGRGAPCHLDIRLLIPTSSHPYFLKAFEQYYSSLEPLQWIDIFTSMLLEKSILFYSKSRQRLTYCIIAAVSLLFPLSWAAPIYPVLSRKLLQFLESPVPFIAGIHSCMFEEARPYITYGTRVVDLDGHHIYVNMPSDELDSESVPTPILDFFGVEFSDRNRFLKSAMTTRSQEFASWKTSKSPMQNYLVHQAEPFFSILVNLLGYYGECRNSSGTIDFQRMVACQACPPLEPFLQRLYESQMVHCFVDDRLASHTVDNFDIQARLLVNKCKERLMQSSSAKLNFGDLRWIECKRSITTNSVINNFRLGHKIGRKFVKLTSKATKKSLRSKSEKYTSPRLGHTESTNGHTPTSSLIANTADGGRSVTYGSSDSRKPVTLSASRTYRTPNASSMAGTPITAGPLQPNRHVPTKGTDYTRGFTRKDTSVLTTHFGGWRGVGENPPSPVEQLSIPAGITLGSLRENLVPPPPVSEILITPTTVNHPRPPVPPKNFAAIPPGVLSFTNEHQNRGTIPPPIPRRFFPNAVPLTTFSSPSKASVSSTNTSSSSTFETHRSDLPESNTPPPALPPRHISILPALSLLALQSHHSPRPLPPLPTSSPQVAITSFSSSKRVNSTPELLDDVEDKEDDEGEHERSSSNSGSKFANTGSVTDGIDRKRDIGGLSLLGFRPLSAFSRSDESRISPFT